MIKIGLHGLGKVGLELEKLISVNSEYQLVGKYAKQNTLEDLIDLCSKSEVIIDFSQGSAIANLAQYSKMHNTKLVIGTTGYNENQMNLIKNLSLSNAVLCSANMLLGVNLLSKLAGICAESLTDAYDIVVTDFHHRNKKDAPSGTALMIAQNMQSKLENKEQNIQFSSIRAGDNYGEHEVIFASNDEVITLKHQALNRAAFAKGALIAAKWIIDKPAGLYTMQDVLR